MIPNNQTSSGSVLTHVQRGTLVQQVRSVIQARIAAGAYSATGRLPSTRQLAQELGTSRSTVVAAYDQLVGEGYVEARERSGLFLNHELLTTNQDIPGCLEADWSGRLVRRFTRPAGPPADWRCYPYPFVTGQMDQALFPSRGWLTQLRSALDGPHASASLDDRGGDDPQLLEALCRVVLPSRGLVVQPNEVAVTMGSQHGLSMLCSLLLRPEDLVAMEDPGYPEARHLFHAFGAKVRPIPVDDQGVRVEAEDLAGVRLLHVTPSHHHPTNVTTTAARRRRLMMAAEAQDAVVVEDDYDSELRYRGRPIPALASGSVGDRCVHLGSFSKLLAPGLRLGFMVGSPDLIAAVRDMQRMTIRQVPGQLQRALAGFLMSEDYYRVLRRVRRELRHRWEVLTNAATTHLALADHAFPPGGTSLWLRSAGEDWTDLPAAAAARGVALTPQKEFYAHQHGPVRHLRLGFTAIPTDRIDLGVRALAAAAADL